MYGSRMLINIFLYFELIMQARWSHLPNTRHAGGLSKIHDLGSTHNRHVWRELVSGNKRSKNAVATRYEEGRSLFGHYHRRTTRRRSPGEHVPSTYSARWLGGRREGVVAVAR